MSTADRRVLVETPDSNGHRVGLSSEGALRCHTLLPQRLAPLPGSLTRSGAPENGLPRSLGAAL